jgi:quercetin dioxygenase-like cupin family protein
MTKTTETTNAFRYLDGYATIVSERVAGSGAIVEFVMPRGSEAPEHAHDEGETVVLLDGEVTFRVAGEIVRPDSHGMVVLPRGVAHSYRVESDDARWLSITPSGRLARFVRAVGEPLSAAAAGPLDVARAVALTAAAAESGIQLLGPAPAAAPTQRASALVERLHAALSDSQRLAPLAA